MSDWSLSRAKARLDRLTLGIGPRQYGGGLLHPADVHPRNSAGRTLGTQAPMFRPAELSLYNLLRAR